ncbi:MAG TPA: beta-N-acetylglucosaminidase domain-containing protein [Verrucomicrobiae bacterium]|jgi:AraC-like DNA-binding protein|nr:beta-N-acetylglucosaminidase domain-containing protein [Verrucomicrobiae bacterium]
MRAILEKALPTKEGPTEAIGLSVLETRREPGFSMEATDDWSQFHFASSGVMRMECDGRSHLVGSDSICHIPAGHAFREEILSTWPALTYVIRYRPDLLPNGVGNQLAGLGFALLDVGVLNVAQTRAIRSLFQEMLFEQNNRQGGWETVLQSRLMDLAVRMLRLVRRRGRHEALVFEPGDNKIDRVARYAQSLTTQFFRQSTITDAARSVGLSRRKFTEVFRQVTGQTWSQCLQSLRLKHAAELLTETDQSVMSISFASGFEDLSHFYHTFKSVHGLSPSAYREQRRLSRVELRETANPEDGRVAPGFKYRGMKGWFWSADQFLEEIPLLSDLKMNFLMDCDSLNIHSQEASGADWWNPMSKAKKQGYGKIIKACRDNKITFCFAFHPYLGVSRGMDARNDRDIEIFHEHYNWAQNQGVQWFCFCLDGTSWGPDGPAKSGLAHARLINAIFTRLRKEDKNSQLLFCPVACWGDGANPDHRVYLEGLAREMHSDVYVFWNGDAEVTPRVTGVAAESYKTTVKHRLFLWDNYPVNNGSPTLHLGPLTGRDPDLCELVDGYLSNPMSPQNQINRLPLSTCAEYAFNPRTYNPARAVGRAVSRMAQTEGQRQVLKMMMEAYPGFLVSGGGTSTNPVREKMKATLAGRNQESVAKDLILRMEQIHAGLLREFPSQFPSTKKTVKADITWLKGQAAAP